MLGTNNLPRSWLPTCSSLLRIAADMAKLLKDTAKCLRRSTTARGGEDGARSYKFYSSVVLVIAEIFHQIINHWSWQLNLLRKMGQLLYFMNWAAIRTSILTGKRRHWRNARTTGGHTGYKLFYPPSTPPQYSPILTTIHSNDQLTIANQRASVGH